MEENSFHPSCNTPQQRQQPETTPAVTTWPDTVPASTDSFEARANWPNLPTETPTVVKVEKTEVPPKVAAIPYAMVLNKPQNKRPAEEKYTWGPHCPICTKEEEEGTEDWNGDR